MTDQVKRTLLILSQNTGIRIAIYIHRFMHYVRGTYEYTNGVFDHTVIHLHKIRTYHY